MTEAKYKWCGNSQDDVAKFLTELGPSRVIGITRTTNFYTVWYWEHNHDEQKLKKDDLMSDYDILTKYMKYPPEEAKEIMERIKLQKLDDLKLQVMAENPICCFGVPLQPEKS